MVGVAEWQALVPSLGLLTVIWGLLGLVLLGVGYEALRDAGYALRGRLPDD